MLCRLRAMSQEKATMALILDQQHERREHFRINDTLFLQYKAIDQATAEQLSQNILNPQLDESNQQQVQLSSLQTAFTLLTDQINHHDRDIARALRLLNEKINILSRGLQNRHDEVDFNSTDVNLSGGGLSFLSAELLNLKSPLSLQIELRSSGIIIDAIANVISCKKNQPENKENPYFLRLAFTKMNETDRNLLIKHILFRQAEELRSNNTKLNSL